MESVFLKELVLKDFRNFALCEIDFHPRFNIIAGRNGMGKTNLLEAVYFFGALRSFRTSVRRELVRHEAISARARATFGSESYGMVCELLLGPDERKLKIDGKTASAASEHFSKLPMVLFHPAAMDLVQQGPQARRRFLTRALFQALPAYPDLHRSYQRALASRNELLKHRSLDHRVVVSFDEQLAHLGSKIVKNRERFVAELQPLFKRSFEEISEGLEADIRYRPRTASDEEAYRGALRDSLERDLARGYTGPGPHADDLDILIEGKPARKFGSQGQQRLVVLALKIAETRALSQATGRIPILLLDDVSSELDRGRNRLLFEFLAKEGGQVLITTTHTDHILIRERRKDFRVEDGTVEVTGG